MPRSSVLISPASRRWPLLLMMAVAGLTVAPGADPGGAERIAALALLAGGVLSGVLAGLLGIGGALVTLPVLWFALPRLGVGDAGLAHAVVGSSLVAMLPTGLAATASQWRRGHIDHAWLSRLAPVMLVGAALGAVVAAALHGLVLALAFAAQSLWYGTSLLARGPVEAGRRAPGRLARATARLPFPLAGAAIAAFCACVGMGGGSLVVPFLQSRGLDFRRTVATGGALNICIAIGGGLAFGLIGPGEFRPAWGPALFVGCVASLAAPLGVALAARLPVSRLGLGVGLVNVGGALALLAQVL